MADNNHHPHNQNYQSHGTVRNNRLFPPTNDDLLKPLLKLNFAKKVAIGSGHVLNDLVGGLWFSYIMIYFENVIGISAASAGYIVLLGQVIDAFFTPLFAIECNQSLFLCKNYGRCKSWHLFGVVLVAISTPFIFMNCLQCEGASDMTKFMYYAPFASICQMGWAATQIAHLALIPKMTPDELVRTEIIAIRNAFTVGSNITVFILAYIFLGLNDKLGPSDSITFTEITLITIAVGIIASVVFHYSVNEQADTTVKRSVAFLNSLPSFDSRRMSISESLVCSTSTRLPTSFNYRRRRSTIGKYSEEARQALLKRDSVAPPVPATVNEDEVSYHHESGRHYDSIAPSVPRMRTNSVVGGFQRSLQVISASVQVLRPTNPLSTTWLSLEQEKMKVKDWVGMLAFYLVALIYMATRLSCNITQVYVPLYLQKSLKLSVGTLATVPLTMYIAGLIITCCMKTLNKYVGRQLSFLFGASLCITGALIVLLADWETEPYMKGFVIYIVAALLGIGGSSMLVTSLSITADLIGSNVESGAFVYGAMSFVDKLSCGIVIGAINYVAPCQIEGEPCDESLVVPFYRDTLAYVAGGTSLVGTIAVIVLTVNIYIRNRLHVLRPADD